MKITKAQLRKIIKEELLKEMGMHYQLTDEVEPSAVAEDLARQLVNLAQELGDPALNEFANDLEVLARSLRGQGVEEL